MGSRLKGRVVIVTGASDGIGKATAAKAAAEGAHVVLCARRPEPLAAAKDEIIKAGGSAEARVVDVSDAQALDALITDVARKHGRLDGLVNNAAKVSMGPLTQITDQEWREVFAAGADAVFVATRAAVRVMEKQGSGSIVNISSTNGRRAMPWMASYSASKAAIIHFSKVVANEFARAGIRCNALAPGMIMTPGNERFFETKRDMLAKAEGAIPMGRAGRPEELANAVLFLLSDESSYVTGICLDVDGGKASQLYTAT
jgi:meso-butanediol dehydrogenase / (S,S)-butanediol dehydrogenase / diacetyl reductase